ncbi:anaerobic ribonucleoside-triphosphate reductase activating protein [Parasphaerochaeta coccoides]|uniref:Anaerobic ribonucleoside-triphosphate reductase-activating protein n=1 Tax=Parasphaerochaeta coccoides (strain ATCC BAA-1237 / DSM 17374 / SPN1) TaxID=760011 RepID=F4GHV6_PARC1|nr:anaerobic ribonucleoside-triphosphate reductase activating protein [Parasphaerochaeta coccoides]AEC02069.1 anaerobic ribonucleoside-triphosphate reductase activating protein [Parasphaerochaeta coccoides DSM 17374]
MAAKRELGFVELTTLGKGTIELAGFVDDSIVDGPGLRVTVFAQGCPHACPGCHNPETWTSGVGREMTVTDIYERIHRNPLFTGVTFSGGDPLFQPSGFADLATLCKAGGYEVACYTGWTFEELQERMKNEPDVRRLLEHVDVLIDGRFVRELRSLSAAWRGSTNQRILNVPESLLAGEAVLESSARWT